MEKPDALRLADWLEDQYDPTYNQEQAAAELRRLHELLEAEQALLQRVIYPELQRLRTQRDALLEALKGITPSMPPADAPCHYGIVPQEKCGHCGRIAKARAAIKAVEEGK